MILEDSVDLTLSEEAYTGITTIPRGITENESYFSFRFDKSGIYAERVFCEKDNPDHLTTLYKHRNETNIPLIIYGSAEPNPGTEATYNANNETTNLTDIVRLNSDKQRFGRFRRIDDDGPKPVLLDEQQLSTMPSEANPKRLQNHSYLVIGNKLRYQPDHPDIQEAAETFSQKM